MNRDDWETIFAHLILLRAENRTLLGAIERIAGQTGFSLGGESSVRDWYKKRCVQETKNLMVSYENADPAGAAAVQTKIDGFLQKGLWSD
jgi:hypothetical protein